MSRFDLVAVVDWSASATPKPRPQADAIWIGLAADQGVQTFYHPTRQAAETALVALIAQARAKGRRLLIGFDFPLGYPEGFARRLTGLPRAAAVWAWLAGAITDGPDNRNNRFAVAAAINRALGGPGPFWGRPAHLDLPDLPARKTIDYAALGLAERRQVETRVPRAQPVWKLYTTGAAGGQSLTGLPMIHRLAQAPDVGVWPFDPDTAITLAEIYPSLLAPAVRAALGPGVIKDQVQVRLLAGALWRLDQGGALWPLLQQAPAPCRREEGWILGAGAADQLLAAA